MNTTSTTKPISTHAACAKAIRTDLKAAFPHTKFSIRAEAFAGGDAVRIAWQDGPTAEEVRTITGRYECGHFDGMIDLYLHDNVDRSIPQVKYVQERREYSYAAIVAATEALNARYGWRLRVSPSGAVEADQASGLMTDWKAWKQNEPRWVLEHNSLICPTCQTPINLGQSECPACDQALPPLVFR